MAIKDRGLADGIARAVASFDPSLLLFGLPGTELLRAGDAAGLPLAAEGFADRNYEADGSLTPRTQPDAVIHDAAAVVTRAVRMAREGVVISRDGEEVPMRVATICTHGDTPGISHACPADPGRARTGRHQGPRRRRRVAANRGGGIASARPFSRTAPIRARAPMRTESLAAETVAATPLGRFATLGMNPPAIAVAFLQTGEATPATGGHP